MSKKLIIAAAGSGKTTYIVNESMKITSERVLITTFTEANEKEIKKKFLSEYGAIPSNITIQTWFSFLIQHGVKPYQSYLYGEDIIGLMLVNQKSGFKYLGKSGPVYYGEGEVNRHYLSSNNQIYSDKLSKFVYKVNELSDGCVIARLAKVFPYMFIDEVQDMAGYDLDIIKLLLSTSIQMTMVGDPRQVVYLTHNEAKYKKYAEGKIVSFLENECKKTVVDIDKDMLNKTYRNKREICQYANTLFTEYDACQWIEQEQDCHEGIFFVKKSDVSVYLEKYKPMQLRDSIATKVNQMHSAMNFGVSKGLTFNRVLIYPTKPMLDWVKNNSSALKFPSRAKLYVAITRARHSVGIVVDDKTNIVADGITYFVP